MKKIFNLLLIASCMFALASCSDEEETPAAELKLDKTSIEVVEEASVSVNIETGNGGYEAAPASVATATVSVSGNTITITGVQEGNTTITVKDGKGKTASIAVTVVSKHTIPTAAQFVWDGKKTDLDVANNWGLAIYANRLAVTNIADKKQYILSWTGDLTVGDKTNGKLQVVGTDPAEINLSSFEVVKADNNAYYIYFESGDKTGNIYFTK